MAQHARNLFAHAHEHGLEHVEGLALVLVQRIALGVAAQADGLAQVVEAHQMLFP